MTFEEFLKSEGRRGYHRDAKQGPQARAVRSGRRTRHETLREEVEGGPFPFPSRISSVHQPDEVKWGGPAGRHRGRGRVKGGAT